MGLSFAQLAKLKDRLHAAALYATVSDTDLLREASVDSPYLRDPLVAQAVAEVAAHLHHPASEDARQLARGALALVMRLEFDAPSPETDLGPTVEMALSLLGEATARAPGGAPLLDEASRGNALALLERCCETPAEGDERLVDSTLVFLESSARLEEGFLFSRMFDDLAFAAASLADRARPADEHRLARGALVYFIERDDAIGDDLGLVGMLDDAFVARVVAERIDPQRRTRNAVLDAVLAQWPFLHQLRLTVDGAPWTPSAMTLLNVGACFLDEGARRTALVVPRTSGLSFLLGVVAAIGRVYEHTRELRPFRPEPGTYVAPAGRPDQAGRVVGYADADGQAGIRIAYLPERGPEVIRWRPLLALSRYVVAKPPARRRRANLEDPDD